MNLQEIKDFLGENLSRACALMAEELRSDIPLLDETNRSMLAHEGKLVRPVLALLVAGACGAVNRDSIHYAAAAELLHNATLLHDDVVDASMERRGRPTVMSLLGGPASVLVGDFWLVRCIRCLLSASRYSEPVIRLYAKTISDLSEGEMLQLEKASTCDTTEEDYFRIIYCKTASLFETTCVGAAMSVDASEEQVEAVRTYARQLGMAFQIRDDMLDYSDGDGIGKPTGQDLREQKITMPLLCALEEVSEQEALAIRSEVSKAADDPARAETVRAFVLSHGGLPAAARRLDGFVESAVSALRVLPDSKEKSYLADMARFVGARDK